MILNTTKPDDRMTYKVRKQSALVTAVREKLYIYLQTERAPESLALGEISTPASLEAGESEHQRVVLVQERIQYHH